MSAGPLRPQHTVPRVLDDLLNRLPGATLHGDAAVTVTGATHDSRQVLPGDLYIARPGEHTHGIDHVAQALGAGAAAVLTDSGSVQCAVDAGAAAVIGVADPREVMGDAAAWAYGDPAAALTMLGVTGTNGKTTTAYLLDGGLRAAGRRTGLLGTIETRVGDEALPSVRTTPEATDLHAMLAVMRERGVDTVTMEVSSHALRLGRVGGAVFDVAGFTNLTQDHLDFHSDMTDYFNAKASLFQPEHARQGVICIDDAWGRRLTSEAGIPFVTTGEAADAGWERTEQSAGADGGTAVLVDPDAARHDIACRLAGQVNLSNAALAYVMLVSAGIDAAAAGAGIGQVSNVPGRMQRVAPEAAFVSFVDYAHTPEAVTGTLVVARQFVTGAGRVIVVLGCGGDRDRAKRPMMGAAAAANADMAVFTSDNPRSEDPEEIVAAMLDGVPAEAFVVVEVDRRAAIAQAVAWARPGDVVLVAGKGHEQGQEIAGQVLPFDDRKVLADAIHSRPVSVP